MPSTDAKRAPRLLYLVTEDWYFCSHRLPLAVAARDAGYDVGVVTQVTDHGAAIRDAGLKLFPIPFARSARKPLQDIRTLLSLWRIYRRERPDLVHHVSIKPIVYGSLAAWLSRVPRVLNAYTGLGFLFTSRRTFTQWMRAVVTRLWQPLLGATRCWSIVQNEDDRAVLSNQGLLHEQRCFLIRGAGVDVSAFTVRDEPDGIPVVMLPARLLWDKGVGEFAAAAERLRTQGMQARFVLVGEPDPENPNSTRREDLLRWQQQGHIECWGRKEDMAQMLAQAHVICLPSYREGLPKVLLEAAACGRAIVTTDTPGCRDIVRHGVNGLLVPVADARTLADAIAELLADSQRRREMGLNGRRIVEEYFTVTQIISETLAAYKTALGKKAQ